MFCSCLIVGCTLSLYSPFKLTLSGYLDLFLRILPSWLFMMLCIIIYYKNSAVSDNNTSWFKSLSLLMSLHTNEAIHHLLTWPSGLLYSISWVTNCYKHTLALQVDQCIDFPSYAAVGLLTMPYEQSISATCLWVSCYPSKAMWVSKLNQCCVHWDHMLE